MSIEYCPNCGAQIDKSMEYCPKCGKKIDRFEKSALNKQRTNNSSKEDSRLDTVLC